MHAENGGKPHCIAVIVDEEKWVTIYDGLQCATCTVSDVYGMFMDSVDASTVVTYRLDKEPTVKKGDIVKELLLLRASGKTVSAGAKKKHETRDKKVSPGAKDPRPKVQVQFPSFTKFRPRRTILKQQQQLQAAALELR